MANNEKQGFFAEIYEAFLGDIQEEKVREILSKVEQSYNIYGKIIDIGSGYGLLEREILKRFESKGKRKSLSLFSLDINADYLEKIGKSIKVRASGVALPFKSNAFDFVFCIDTLHILKNAYEITRVLKPKGKAVLSIFCTEHNFEERRNFLSDIILKAQRLKEKESFMIKAEKEWDFVIIAEKI